MIIKGTKILSALSWLCFWSLVTASTSPSLHPFEDPFPQLPELEEALHDMPLAEAYYTLHDYDCSDAGSSKDNAYLGLDSTSPPWTIGAGLQHTHFPVEGLNNTADYSLYGHSNDDMSIYGSSKHYDVQDSDEVLGCSHTTSSESSQGHASTLAGLEKTKSKTTKDRREYYKDYNQKRRERHAPHWRWLVENKSKDIQKMIKMVAVLNKISDKVARTRLELYLTEQLHNELLSLGTVEQKMALHFFDFKSPDELFSETEKVILFKDYFKKNNDEIYNTPRRILRVASIYLTDVEKQFIKSRIFKTPQDYISIAEMMKRAVHEARLQEWHKKREANML